MFLVFACADETHRYIGGERSNEHQDEGDNLAGRSQGVVRSHDASSKALKYASRSMPHGRKNCRLVLLTTPHALQNGKGGPAP